MDDNERTLRLDEYKKIREELLKEMNTINYQNDNLDNQDNIDYNGGNDNNKVKSFNNGHYKESKSNNIDYYDRKAGMVNILMLSIMSFIFECLFLYLSFMMYK